MAAKAKLPAGWRKRDEESRSQYYQAMQRLAAKGDVAAVASLAAIDSTGWAPTTRGAA